MTRRQLLRSGIALGAASLLPAACRPRGPKVERPNVLVVTLDTTRADRLGCYGYARPTSPRVDALAERSTVYTRAISSGTWTLPSHASLFTGRYPSSHGARYDPNGPLSLASVMTDRATSDYRVSGMSPSETTMAHVLGRAGYRTGGVGGGPWMKKIFGLGTGFEWWDDDGVDSANGRLAADVTASALRWLETVSPPFLLFLNYFDPHGPWLPPDGFGDQFLPAPIVAGTKPSVEQKLALYDGEIRYADHHFGVLLDALQRRGLYDSTWILVTSDHGEMLGEHGKYGHGTIPYQTVLHIPLISKPPLGDGGLGERSEWIQLTDVLPLVLTRLGLPFHEGIQGGVPPTDRPIIAESYTLPSVYRDGDWRAIIEGDWKLLWNTQGKSALYDLASDPGEQRNRIEERRDQAAALERTMSEYLAALPRSQSTGAAAQVDEKTRKSLESLGYVQ